ncbi:MAG: hypothetical protein NZ735_06440 [Candidatus Marinimicrobia bacterium]|nr:hypothetical protein [Candidatus Neomarinimicrobiota bacterium]
MKKEQIELRIEEIKSLVLNSQKDQSNYIGELTELNEELAKLNAPIMTIDQAVTLKSEIVSVFDDFDFSNTDHYDFEFEIDYDGKVCVSHIDADGILDNIEDVVEELIQDFFKVQEDDDDIS